MSAVYAVYTSPTHPPMPNHLPTLIVTPHGNAQNILYSYLHTNFNSENYLLTPSPQGELCVAKLFPPKPPGARGQTADAAHASTSRVVRCEASRNLKWSIANTGVMSPIYKLSLPSPDSADLPLFQISKPNPNAAFWSMFYFAYAGHNIPPKRIEFGKIQKNPPGQGGGGTRISITGKTAEEKAVWQTLGEGNEDCVEWVVLCAALNLLDDEILKAADKNPAILNSAAPQRAGTGPPPQGVSLRDPGPGSAPRGLTQQRPPLSSGPRPGPNPQQTYPPPGPSRGFPPNGQPGQHPPPNGHPGQHLPPNGHHGQHPPPPGGTPGQHGPPPGGIPGQHGPPPGGIPGQHPLPPGGIPGQHPPPPGGYPQYQPHQVPPQGFLQQGRPAPPPGNFAPQAQPRHF